jgi:predicted nucleic acid-binding protein
MMLLDTSGLLCCFDADEARHAEAVQFYEAAPLRLTHNYVLAEFVALTQARRLPREASLSFATELTIDADVELVWIDRQMHDEAMQVLRTQLDKAYSICDAISFILMRQRGILEALTTDRHFDQAGFRRLLAH